ncbi:MAG: hypothetical protein AW07_00296 [Candidatus Accumulibacter sp. SK-11]|nr:MAG: hypothetical protein AW07_00296 [Candidatus Accumulibacter sp. SK-11]
MLPEWLLKVMHGERMSITAAPWWARAARSSGTSCVLSPEKPRATKVAPMTSASVTRSIGASLLLWPFLEREPLSAVAENWPLVRP